MIEIKITEQMRTLAAEDKYKKITSGREYILPTSEFWAGENQYQNFIGNIGEMAFEEYLKTNNIIYTKDILYKGHGDYFDFMVLDKKIDVKTGHFKGEDDIRTKGFPSNYNFFIAEKQTDKPVDFYVHIQVDQSVTCAFIVGYIPREKIQKYTVVKTEAMYYPAVSIPFSALVPISQLYELKEKDTVDKWM